MGYTSNNVTATTADNDYTDNDGSLVFAGTAGESHTITVNTTTDIKVELNETFTVALGAITGAPAGVTTAGSPQIGTILNDDAAVVAIAADISQAENITPQVFAVNLSNPVDVKVSVQFFNLRWNSDHLRTMIIQESTTRYHFTAGTTTIARR
ncbi:MAG: hypothetical protein IPP25_22235 [Saprospiraceae bacterium]|nr:hypothetical protein [Candidatus Opimibacter skivensis]